MSFERRELDSLIKQDKSGYYFAKYNGLLLRSVFQAIVKNDTDIIGYEALLRITTNDGSQLRADHFFKSPYFSFDCKTFVERLSRTIHIKNFAISSERQTNLFLNTIPRSNEHFLNNARNTKLLMQRLDELELKSSQIVIEIVESGSYNEKRLKQSIDHLKDLGFSIAIDDYGVESSNIDRVNLIQPNIIKVDKSLLEDFTQGRQQGLCEALNLGASINAQTLVEGIETEEQFLSISDLNVGMYQGFHFATPYRLDVDSQRNYSYTKNLELINF